jgi:hypothetical protein
VQRLIEFYRNSTCQFMVPSNSPKGGENELSVKH